MTKKEIREVIEEELVYRIESYYRRKAHGQNFITDEAKTEALQTLVVAERLGLLTDVQWKNCLGILCYMGSDTKMERRLAD